MAAPTSKVTVQISVVAGDIQTSVKRTITLEEYDFGNEISTAQDLILELASAADDNITRAAKPGKGRKLAVVNGDDED